VSAAERRDVAERAGQYVACFGGRLLQQRQTNRIKHYVVAYVVMYSYDNVYLSCVNK